MKKIIIIGFGGHTKSVADAIDTLGEYHIVGYTEIEDKGTYHGYKYLGTDDVLEEYYKKGVRNAFICVGYLGISNLRDNLYNRVKRIGFNLPIIIDKSAIIASDVYIGEGTFVGKGSIINSSSVIGNMCIINTGSIVEHDNNIGGFTHIAVGATLCGGVSVGSHCLIGANTTVIQCKKIGDDCIVGANSTILCDLNSGTKCCGVVKE